MRTGRTISKVGGYVGEHLVCEELSKREIANALLAEGSREELFAQRTSNIRTYTDQGVPPGSAGHICIAKDRREMGYKRLR